MLVAQYVLVYWTQAHTKDSFKDRRRSLSGCWRISTNKCPLQTLVIFDRMRLGAVYSALRALAVLCQPCGRLLCPPRVSAFARIYTFAITTTLLPPPPCIPTSYPTLLSINRINLPPLTRYLNILFSTIRLQSITKMILVSPLLLSGLYVFCAVTCAAAQYPTRPRAPGVAFRLTPDYG